MMTDDLRTRIAAILRSELLGINYSHAVESADGGQWVFIDGTVIPDDLADAVIRELKQQWRADYGYDGYQNCDTRDEAAERVASFNGALGDDWQDGEQAMVMRRYVTEWTTDE